uniref:Tumor necrosis factor ligand superfamily member n=1 Tax=Cavia porcellus TaxID=10141 RepID=A0A286Y0I6_CAVPO
MGKLYSGEIMSSVQTLGGPSPGQTCVLILIFTVLLQSLCVAVTYIYFTNELKQIQEYSKSGIACFLKEDDGSWDPQDDDSMNSPCWQLKWKLRQFVRKMILTAFEETIPTSQESQVSLTQRQDRGLQRAAAHITGTTRKSTKSIDRASKNEKALGYKVLYWESSRKGHSFLNNLHLRNGELVIHQAGLYYIYSQIYFRFQESEETSASKEERRKNKQMVQYIYKFTNYPEPIMLMKSARNSCWSKESEYGLYSIYQGGVFELKENDRIFVSVTNESLIDWDQEASFFGAFLLS